jgi:uncharacterized SAM-binding protein YcdF (DUF218 family)
METWSYAWAVRNLIAELIMPPGIWVIWVFFMLFLLKKHELIKNTLIIFGLAMIWVTSTNYFANQFTQFAGHILVWPQALILDEEKLNVSKASDTHQSPTNSAYTQEQIPKDVITQLPNTKLDFGKDEKYLFEQQGTHAIVILGGGTQKGAKDLPEYQYQNTSPQSMERLRAGARLAKVTKLPVLLTGGAPDRTDTKDLSEAKVMSMVLKEELGIDARWLEEQSNTTQENALQSAQILNKEGIKTIYLVTHFWHMPRAKIQFEKQGLTVIEAPMGFYQKDLFTPLDFYPSSEGLQRTRWIWHEILGSACYNLRFLY